MVIEVLTGILVVITAMYAYLTLRIAKATEASVSMMNRQMEATTHPVRQVPPVRLKATHRGSATMVGTTIAVSRKRMLLAVYVDLLLFLIVWGLVNFLIGGQAHFIGGFIVFAVIRVITWKLNVAPGLYFLSIGRDRLVDSAIYERENWLTMLLGTLFVLEGAKKLLNWTQGVAPEPFFGLMPGDTAQVALDMVSGVLLILIGFLYFKMRVLGFWLAVVTATGGLISVAVSWSLWTAAVPQIVLTRRAAQGRVPSESELQFMQAFLPSLTVALLLCVLVAVLLSYSRFSFRGFGSHTASP